MGESEEFEAAGIIFMPDGLIVKFNRIGNSWLHAEYYSEGSGCDYACGAMAMGASAEESVRIAIKFDISSGGLIQTLRH
jgi:hypothetical protein